VAVGAGRIRLIPTDERRSLMLTVTELELLAVSTFTAAFRHANAAWISFERLYRRVRLGSGAEGWGVAATAKPRPGEFVPRSSVVGLVQRRAVHGCELLEAVMIKGALRRPGRTHTCTSIERIPLAPTVGRDLGKRRCAQRLPAFS